MKKTIDEFYAEHDVRIGKDFQTTPPIYYQSLKEGLYGYFNTILGVKNKYNLLLNDDVRSRQNIAFNFNDSDSTVSCILGIHRFFELLLKDLLARVNPFLAVKLLENEKQQIAFLNQTLDYEKVNTIEFSEALKRFTELCNSNEVELKNLDISKIIPFRFIIADDTLKQLSKWRNRIIHNGKTLPNLFALDYLITQKVLPIISILLEVEKPILKTYYPHFFITPSGINILNSILAVKFNYMDFYTTLPDEKRFLIRQLFIIGHIKELARASFNFDRSVIKSNVSYEEPYYENPKEKYYRIAKAEESNSCFHETKTCPSCSIPSLIVYKKIVDNIFTNQQDDFYYCRCTSCDYFFSENFADPFVLGLTSARIFPQH